MGRTSRPNTELGVIRWNPQKRGLVSDVFVVGAEVAFGSGDGRAEEGPPRRYLRVMLSPGLALLTLLEVTQLPPGGTPPGGLRVPLDAPASCSCHFDYQQGTVIEPGQSYIATPMALSARDPFFRAAFVVARRDRPELSALCVRCHAPTAWLSGRANGDLDLLEDEDLQGVGCDVCHRMVVEDPPLIGDARMTFAQSSAKRSRRGSPPFGGHAVTRTEDLVRSEACGVCHSLFNPLEVAHDHQGRPLGFAYYEQRTYEEWISSIYPGEARGCVDCHMTRASGPSTDGGRVHADLWVHDMVGGNAVLARAVHALDPTLGLSGLLPALDRMVEESLRRAADLEIWTTGPLELAAGEPFEVRVRITNRTGHKLPTGYPEGRRVYLEVSFVMAGSDAPSVVIGAWDPERGDLVDHPQLVKYETLHGRVEGSGPGRRIQSLLLMNQVLVDTRIPPEGFVPVFEDMVPTPPTFGGRDYGAAAPYRHFDEPTFTLEAPALAGGTSRSMTIRVRAMYQALHAEAVDYLIEETRGTPEGAAVREAWERVDRAPPQEMARAELEVRVLPPRESSQDAGVGERADARTSSGDQRGPPRMAAPLEGGCRAAGAAMEGASLVLIALAGVAGLGRRRRFAPSPLGAGAELRPARPDASSSTGSR